jgi:ubiquinone/menaquinone biosynthesis C-methylase UbiE
MLSKAKISKYLRDYKLLFLSDKMRFFLIKFKNKKNNHLFKKNNPNIILPPDYLMYESFRLDYKRYFEGGKNTANWLKEIFGKHKNLENLKILDWGCGPARVIRHFPNILNNSVFFGTDYNENSIIWNKKNIKNINFNLNSLEAKLPYENNFFDVIYGISIFTHLSEEKHLEWKKELYRILKPEGILLLTLQGDAFKSILTEEENKIYDNGDIIVRGKVKEGHRTFSAFHPKNYVNNLFYDMKILEHIESKNNNGNLEQDVWVFQK